MELELAAPYPEKITVIADSAGKWFTVPAPASDKMKPASGFLSYESHDASAVKKHGLESPCYPKRSEALN